ncbi:MAG: TIGR03086 family metal-binding protein [Acidimicrobiales bacterium]
MSEYKTFDRAVTTAAGAIKGVRADQMDLPTPCSEWTVRDLLNHLAGSLWFHHQLLSGTPVPHPATAGGLPDVDLVGDDPTAAFAEAAAASLASAAADGAMARAIQTPLGEMPGGALTKFIALDMVVHGWDLATATGQDYEVPAELATQILGFARMAINDGTRGPYIAPAVGVDPSASDLEQLVGHMGRAPGA